MRKRQAERVCHDSAIKTRKRQAERVCHNSVKGTARPGMPDKADMPYKADIILENARMIGALRSKRAMDPLRDN